ncbi:hypothetical protein F7Q99_20270 [Streptomyces kaniharaensis]|uniref:Uncharacterized protein n=1 Tax=Streptomyces kaniharaensis TaxID=212423 RepID=A0A6N7KUM5_9ACTN|nr:hypothetical protein [Streptomyces kaniharaensis]MQS14535.1 hypothetical protein [Streptomyces kaniharaensis]
MTTANQPSRPWTRELAGTSDLTVTVDGYLEPMMLPFDVALTTLWQVVRQLPIGEYQHRAMHRLLGAGRTLEMERLLDGTGSMELRLDLTGGGTAVVRVCRAGAEGLETP